MTFETDTSYCDKKHFENRILVSTPQSNLAF